jgi:hypothetical protein
MAKRIEKNEAARAVADALLGADFRTVVIGGRAYTIKPPTIRTICAAVRHFSQTEFVGETISDAVRSLPGISDNLLKGLSCFIRGDESLAEELSGGTFDEAVTALETCLSMIDVSAFRSVSSMRNVSTLAARPKR